MKRFTHIKLIHEDADQPAIDAFLKDMRAKNLLHSTKTSPYNGVPFNYTVLQGDKK